MRFEWEKVQVSDLIADQILEIGDGYRAKNSEMEDAGLPFVRVSNVANGTISFTDIDLLGQSSVKRAGAKCSQPGDVVFTSKGTVGRFAFVQRHTPKFIYSPQLCYWRSLDEKIIEPRYLYYWMNSKSFWDQAVSVKGQTDMADYVSLRDQRHMYLDLPPLPEQKRIAHILGSLDDKIELNRQMNKTLEAMAQALFKSWFIDFDPVHAKMEGRDPSGMDPQTAALFPNKLTDSPLGPIPEGWEVKPLAECVDVNAENIRKDYPFQQIEYLDISSVSEGETDGTTSVLLKDAPSRARRIVSHGDTIWSMVRPNRRSYLFIHEPPENMVVSTGFAVLSPRSISPTYLYYSVTTPRFVDYLTNNATGSAYPAVKVNTFKRANILLPPQQLMERWEALVAPIQDQIAANAEQSVALHEIRDEKMKVLFFV